MWTVKQLTDDFITFKNKKKTHAGNGDSFLMQTSTLAVHPHTHTRVLTKEKLEEMRLR